MIPGLERSPGGGHSNRPQYSCLEDPRGQRSLAGCSPWGHKEPDMTEDMQNHYALHLKLTHYKSTTIQLKKQKKAIGTIHARDNHLSFRQFSK